ncbi:hypothetical protein [Kitasatospora sp. NPDC086791]|uniref:hypothetical protein n=1 Tax=Kitasatospora sp. NPDC086791 TaxID=3155178 RepID=UPI003441127D
MYSYDVSASPGRSTAAPRSIPGMRPSYDAEHPHSTTPIYDALYSEYRRLFRALPGDRSGEENLVFTGFAVRDGYPLLGEQRPYPPSQQQAFHTLAGQAPSLPQFMAPQPHGVSSASGHQGHHHSHSGNHHHNPHSQHNQHGQHGQQSHHSAHPGGHHGHHPGAHSGTHPEPAAPTNDGRGHPTPAPTPATPPMTQPASSAAQFTNGQGWVAAGYLGQLPHPVSVPAPSPPAPPAPSPVMGTATGLAAAPSTGGRHRQMLSLPPGRNGDHH